jgi:phosphoribosylglycinamide formyltransferase-1
MPARGPLRLAILISGRGSNMVAIANACARRSIDACVAGVIADRETAGGLERARALGLATRIVPFTAYPDRETFEAVLEPAIAECGAELVALAGFMRVLTPAFAARHLGRMLNIHPALLPAFRGLHTHRRALAAGALWHGSSVHYVTAELDGGPVILQARISVRPGDDAASLSARVQTCEHIIYPRVIGWIAAGRLGWSGGGPQLDGVPLRAPLVEDFDEV